jgi:hypothetical protein
MLTAMNYEVTTQTGLVLEALVEVLAIPRKRTTLATLIQRANTGEKIEYRGATLTVSFERQALSTTKQHYKLLVEHNHGAPETAEIQIAMAGAATSDDAFAWAKLESAAKKMRKVVEHSKKPTITE